MDNFEVRTASELAEELAALEVEKQLRLREQAEEERQAKLRAEAEKLAAQQAVEDERLAKIAAEQAAIDAAAAELANTRMTPETPEPSINVALLAVNNDGDMQAVSSINSSVIVYWFNSAI